MSTAATSIDNQDFIPPGKPSSTMNRSVYVGRETRAQKRRLEEIERGEDPRTDPVTETTQEKPTPKKLRLLNSSRPPAAKKPTKKRASQTAKACTVRVEQETRITTQKKLRFGTKKNAPAAPTVDMVDREIIPEPTKAGSSKILLKRKDTTVKQNIILIQPAGEAKAGGKGKSQDQDTIEVDEYQSEVTKLLIHRKPPGSRPPARGQPAVWATGRQEICESLPYYKAHHGACYVNKGVVYSFMLDGGGQIREYMDENVIICRAGGSMDSDGKGSTLQCKNHSLDGSQPQAVLNNMLHQNPLVIICGDRNAASPVDMPHRYCVLGWYKPTHVWAELIVGKAGKRFVSVKYRFERLDRTEPAWFAPITPALTEDQEQAISPLETQVCTSCHKESPTVLLSGWMCLNPPCQHFSRRNGWPVSDTVQYSPSFLRHKSTPWSFQAAPFSVNPGLPELSGAFGNNLHYINTRGIVCPKCGRCNQRYLFTGWKCDNKGCDWALPVSYEGMTHRNLNHDPWDIVSDGPALTKSTSKAVVQVDVKHTHNYKVSKYIIPGIEGCVVHAKANRAVVEEPQGPDEMFKALQLEDIGLVRRTFVKDSAVKKPRETRQQAEDSKAPDQQRKSDGVVRNEDVSQKQEMELDAPGDWKISTTAGPVYKRASSVPTSTRPAADTGPADVFDQGIEAKQRRQASDPATPGLSVDEAKATLTKLAASMLSNWNYSSTNIADRASSRARSTLDTTNLDLMTTAADSRLPSIVNDSTEMDVEADATQAFRLDDPDDLANDGRMLSFSNNFGMPYKFVAGVDSQSFDSSAWPIRACRSRLNWALRTLLGEIDPRKHFNELLAIGYLERQKISYHDDGEAGLGPVIATLSLGSAATMSLRLKGKYFSSVSKASCFTYTRPLPLEVIQHSAVPAQRLSQAQYDERVIAFKELQAIKETQSKNSNFMQRSRKLPKELDLRFKTAQPLLDLHLTHGDIVVMQGEAIQKYFEHAVEPHGSLRFALTCRQILPHHLTDSQKPTYEVGPDTYGYDGQQIRRDGDADILQW